MPEDRGPAPTPTVQPPQAESEELFPPPLHRQRPLRRAATATLGVICILVGVVLGVLPIVPGFPLIAIGVLLLAASSEPSRRLLNSGDRHLPAPVRRVLRRITKGRRPTS